MSLSLLFYSSLGKDYFNAPFLSKSEALIDVIGENGREMTDINYMLSKTEFEIVLF